jgi:thymidylate kinase
LQTRVHQSYLAQAAAAGWVVLNGERAKDAIAADVFSALASRLALP